MSVVLESFWTQLWIFFLNGALYLGRILTRTTQLNPCTQIHDHCYTVENKRSNLDWGWILTLSTSQARQLYLLLIKEPSTIKLSSINATISDVLSPRSRSSPRFLKLANVSSRVLQSATTDFSLASMSFSLTAAIHTSCLGK